MTRTWPNILLTGTPGTGKTSVSEKLMTREPFKDHFTLLNVGDFVKANNLYEGFDEEYGCHVLDEDRLIEQLEPLLGQEKGFLFDYHGCDLFPSKWFDAVFVLRTSNTTLYDRLVERGYSGKKLEDNLQCEIFQTISDEANECFETVIELGNDSEADLEANLEKILEWVDEWRKGKT